MSRVVLRVQDYLNAKHDSGHMLERSVRLEGAEPPSRVRVFEPVALPGDDRRVVTASYFLPVGLPDASSEREGEWFRLSVVYDRDREQESILLTLGDEGRVGEVEATVHMQLLDRLPFPRSQGRTALARALASIRMRGQGAVAVRFDDRDLADVTDDLE